jgi:hypothetical protein
MRVSAGTGFSQGESYHTNALLLSRHFGKERRGSFAAQGGVG